MNRNSDDADTLLINFLYARGIAAIREDQKFYNSVKQDVAIDLLVNAGAAAAQENAGFGIEEAKKTS